jgi:superfamily II DNA or RNA helicase
LKPLYKILSTTSDWSTFFIHANALKKHEKGELFEKLTELVLLTKPVYKARYKNVWLLRDGIDSKLRARLKLPNVDEGIDLIAESYNGSYCSIQCKFKGANESPTRKDIATFLDLSRNHCKNITEQILVHTGTSGIKKTALLPESFTQIGLDFWSQLTEEDWLAIQYLVKGKKPPSVKRNPRPHQQDAIAASKQYFLTKKNTRGKLIMPCGSGKSLTAFWISQALASKTTIIALPSLILLNKTLEDWTKEISDSNLRLYPEWCCICSDETAGKLNDDLVSDIFSSGIPTTTNEGVIATFLKRKTPVGKIIFTTYQSADKLAQVSKRLKFKFDLAILDEAHKTVGVKDKAFSILLQEDKISISKRLFMTATERIVKGKDDEILSMDDTNVYGNVFYKLSFKKAIEDGIITDYKILTVLLNDAEVDDWIKNKKYLSDANLKIDNADPQMVIAAIALQKAIKEYNINHTVSFHKSINASKEFQSLYQKIDVGKASTAVFHISSKLNAGARAELLKDFRNTSKAIITNARCLTEGVDVPAIDCVLFADQKQSVVDIVQASGRALRQYTDKNTGVKKEVGYIIIPVVIKKGESLDELTESSRFKTVTRIVTSLSTQDETIAEELNLVDAGTQKAGSGKIQVIGSVNKSIKIDLATFSLKISTKIWERVAKLNWLPFEEARNYARGLKFTNVRQWQEFFTTKSMPLNLPTAPNVTYLNNGWISWGDWLGNDNISVHNRVYVDFEEARDYARTLNLNNSKQWKTFFGFKKNINGIPKYPEKIYKNKGWINWGDWLGSFHSANYKKPYLSYSEAIAFVKGLGLRTRGQWDEYIKSGKKPENIPSSPWKSYENKGWVSINDWLGNDEVSILSFDLARDLIRKKKFKNVNEFRIYCKSTEKTSAIPVSPNMVYKHSGWISWSDWLGNKNLATKNIPFVDFAEARSWAISKKFSSITEYKLFCKTSNRPFFIPTNPNRTYKNSGWVNWGDYLGAEIISNRDKIHLSFNDAKKIVKSLNLKSRKEWELIRKNKKLPIGIPSNPSIKYKNSGWKGWGDWLGNGNVRTGTIPYLNFHAARKVARGFKLKSNKEWGVYLKEKYKQKNLPASPDYFYKNKGWKGWPDWLGK